MTQHDAAIAEPEEADAAADGFAPQVRLGDKAPAGETGSRSDVRLVVADGEPDTSPTLGEVSEPPRPTVDVSTSPSRKPTKKRRKKASGAQKSSQPKPDDQAAVLSGAEWRAARTKSTMRLSPEVQRKIQVRSVTEALEQQVVVEIALRQFFGMEPLSADMKRDARARAVWAAMNSESVA